jgi:hypothetical protein
VPSQEHWVWQCSESRLPEMVSNCARRNIDAFVQRMYARLAGVRLGICISLRQNGHADREAPIPSYGIDSSAVYLFVWVPRFGGVVPVPVGAFVLRFALCIFFGWMIRRGYLRRDPVVGYCLLFILLTAIGVSGLRADLGLMQSMSSRYRIYSDLLLIFAWFALVKTSRIAEAPTLRSSRLFVGVVTVSVLFCIVMDGIGVRNLRKRDRNLEHGMALFERSSGSISPVYSEDGKVQGYPGFDEYAKKVLLESEEAATYEPPQY